MIFHLPKMQEIAAGQTVAVEKQDDDAFDPIKAVVLILSLYKDDFFDVPRFGVVEEGWRTDWFKKGSLERVTYEVTKDEWPRFKNFLDVAQRQTPPEYGDPLVRVLMSQHWFSAAADRYLRATFARGDSYSFGATVQTERRGEDVIEVRNFVPDPRSLKEEVLLNYVFGLEVLAGEQQHGNAGPKSNPAERVTALIARDDREERWVRQFLNSAYKARNDFVHASEEESVPDLRVLRRCFQRVLGLVLTLSEEGLNVHQVRERLQQPQSPKFLEVIRKARGRLLQLISDDTPLDKWESPTYGGRSRI